MATRKWTEEQRAQQSLKIRQWQPWQHSTGAKTAEGKAKSSRNAYKASVMQKIKLLSKQLNLVLCEQKREIQEIRKMMIE
jgi:hypothetical protein